ncbi:UDP-N-acetylglucosamine 2-epimerase [Neolewinella lacunae]|uniref:UDP-N-acetylglucosamine 2-epimerase (Hydrolyzing) n=1 Tax=Neolewinella lacunae TaxID=1517758 RepID=A0A923T833_9BACT|nr:UDP-N-acetylglucosamine 2-epimerase [Neolewinella lacunae]MBC6994151.1 UDP-N-acetylglucosamine 2-epimerase (hydrolyzing) [Neolewinella lacunae]MDN3636700.1 UDP-N-acetylglucosamine 2-epimerase [Neolewinella lacunae]
MTTTAPRKVCVVVTARPSYSRIKTALHAIDAHPELTLQLVVAGSALLERYGTAVHYIEADGFSIAARVFNVLEGENLTAQAKTTGLGIMELSSVFANLQPDVVVTVADRFETMATAIAASYMNIPLVHIQGGEVTGNIDEKVRHAITKLADRHLVASEDARQRVIRLGEVPETVVNTGCPSIDLAAAVRASPALDFDLFARYGGVGERLDLSGGYLVVMQHPVTTEYADARRHIELTLAAVASLNLPTLWFWPNVDAGSDGTSKGIRVYRERYRLPHFHFFKNMEGSDFLRVLANARCLVGNSSVGIRECAYLGVPVVNIGTRQDGRQRGPNVRDVPYDTEAIVAAIQQQVAHGLFPPSNVYGGGAAGAMIAAELARMGLSFSKRITY